MCFKDVQQRCRMDGFRIDGFKDLWIFGCKYNTIFTLMQVLGWCRGAPGLFPGGGLVAAEKAEEACDDGGVHEQEIIAKFDPFGALLDGGEEAGQYPGDIDTQLEDEKYFVEQWCAGQEA